MLRIHFLWQIALHLYRRNSDGKGHRFLKKILNFFPEAIYPAFWDESTAGMHHICNISASKKKQIRISEETNCKRCGYLPKVFLDFAEKVNRIERELANPWRHLHERVISYE